MRKINCLLVAALCLIILESCEKNPADTNNNIEPVKQITILYTNDEHGWMEPNAPYGGAAGLMGIWHDVEGYTSDGNYLILSGGDNWTGPALSTWTFGESMVDVMNGMQYDASAIGNHEFDFTVDTLYARVDQADFPFLAANIIDKSTGEIPDFAQPYIIQEVDGIKIGIMGLSSISTYTSTHPDNVTNLDFTSYTDALNSFIPLMNADGAEIQIVIGHICASEIYAIIPVAADLGVDLITGGHCNQLMSEMTSDVSILIAGKYLQSYGRVDIHYNSESQTIEETELTVKNNIGETSDPEIETIVESWQATIGPMLNRVIGYTADGIGRSSYSMLNMVGDSWLLALPGADIAFTNRGGIRQDIPAGEITVATIMGLLPFANFILELELNGAEIMDYLDSDWPAIGGMTTIDGYKLLNGTPLEATETYRVLINDYMYTANDGNTWSLIDPNPFDTNIHYRQPLIDWIESLGTTASNPLENYLDQTPRQ